MPNALLGGVSASVCMRFQFLPLNHYEEENGRFKLMMRQEITQTVRNHLSLMFGDKGCDVEIILLPENLQVRQSFDRVMAAYKAVNKSTNVTDESSDKVDQQVITPMNELENRFNEFLRTACLQNGESTAQDSVLTR